MGYSVPSPSSSLVPPVAPVPSSLLAPVFPFSFAPTVPHPPADTSAGPCAPSSLGGGGGGPSCTVFVNVPGTLGASFDFTDPLHCQNGEDPFDKGDAVSHPLGHADHSQAFMRLSSSLQVFFPGAKSLNPVLWTERLGLTTLGCLVSMILTFSSHFLTSCPSKRRLMISLSK